MKQNYYLGVTNMGRNRSNATAAAVKGNLVAGTGVDTSGLLTVGANDTVLTADSAEATGMKWAAGASGGMTSIASGTLSGSSVSLTSIPQTFNSLILQIKKFTASALNQTIRLTINSQTLGVYQYYNVDTAAATTLGIDQAFIQPCPANSLGTAPNDGNFLYISFLNYTDTDARKYGQQQYWSEVGSPATKPIFGFWCSNQNYSFPAITSIQIKPSSGTFGQGAYTLFGVK
jgi:hypothetical protein